MPELVPPVVAAGGLSGSAQPSLAANGLTLRPWIYEDAGALVEAYADPEIQRWHVRSMDEAEARDWVAERDLRWRDELGVDWAIADGSGVLGRVGFRSLNLVDGRAEAAYWVLPHARGRGVAGRALHVASDWMLDEIGFHRLELMHSPDNTASCRVADKAGYVEEGIQRETVLHTDGWHDMHVHIRLAARPGR
jgi:[ribosomal protein S5]-alanine N-acetyltransferase